MGDKIGEWSENKLEILEKYLNAYTKIFNNQKWCRGFHYIDAFAASGVHISKDEQRFINGSPRVALNLEIPFSSYTFIEKDSDRIEKLNSLKSEFADKKIEILEGDCNKLILEKIVPRIRYDKCERGFVFLDPYGLNVEMETVKCLAKAEAFEVFINFSVMDANRNIRRTDPNKRDEKEKERMNKMMGDENWENEISEIQGNLFEEKGDIIYKNWYSLLGAYKKRLCNEFEFVSEELPMYSDTGAPLYALFFAGQNETGKKIMNDIIKTYQRPRK